MKSFSSILVPLDGSETAAQCLGAASWLADRLDAELHVLSAVGHELPAREALERLKVPREIWPRVTLHQAAEFPEKALLEAVEQFGNDLVVMMARGEAAESEGLEDDPFKLLGHVTRWIVERCDAPVLVMPPHYRERLPWTSVLVPISGEFEADAALGVAVRLAKCAGLEVEVAHVVGAGDEQTGLAAEVRYADALHHEYPSRLQALVSRLLPECGPEECTCIRDVLLCRGEPGDELLGLIDEHDTSLLVIGWHGSFVQGHANVVKRLLASIECPVLLVKSAPPAPFKLKVGEEIE